MVAGRHLQETNGTLALIGLRGTVKEVMEIAGLSGVFPSYTTESELLAARPDWH